MLATMSDVLRVKFKVKKMTVEILNSLQEIFRLKNEQVCIEIRGKYTTTRMKSESKESCHDDDKLLHKS